MSKIMKLVYLANNRFPTEKAQGLQIAKMCEAFIEAGVDLTVLVPKRIQTSHVNTDSPKDFYKLRNEIPVKRVWSLDLLSSRWFPQLPAYFLQTLSFSFLVKKAIKKHSKHVLYSRTLLPIRILKGRNWFYEAHTFPKTRYGQRYQSRVLKKANGVVCISEGIADKYRRILPNSVPVLVAHDGVDLSLFG